MISKIQPDFLTLHCKNLMKAFNTKDYLPFVTDKFALWFRNSQYRWQFLHEKPEIKSHQIIYPENGVHPILLRIEFFYYIKAKDEIIPIPQKEEWRFVVHQQKLYLDDIVIL
ncbi:MAG: hypothetical protein ACH0QD_13250 [Tepidibacillus sp.]